LFAKKEHIFIVIIVALIIIAGSGLLIWQTIRQNRIVTGGLEDSSDSLSVDDNSLRKDEKNQQKENIYVHITGAVKKCGVYKLEKGARVVDVLQAAGGGSKEAVLEKINLAARVYDGDQIYIPDKNDSVAQTKIIDSKEKQKNINNSENSTINTDKININRASKSQLEKLPGIGPSKAEKIIAYRNDIGKFKDYQELLLVKGIGEKTLENIKEELSLK